MAGWNYSRVRDSLKPLLPSSWQSSRQRIETTSAWRSSWNFWPRTKKGCSGPAAVLARLGGRTISWTHTRIGSMQVAPREFYGPCKARIFRIHLFSNPVPLTTEFILIGTFFIFIFRTEDAVPFVTSSYYWNHFISIHIISFRSECIVFLDVSSQNIETVR